MRPAEIKVLALLFLLIALSMCAGGCKADQSGGPAEKSMVYGDAVYYIKRINDGSHIYKMMLDGSGMESIYTIPDKETTSTEINALFVQDGTVYFHTETAMGKVGTDGEGLALFDNTGGWVFEGSSFYVCDGSLYSLYDPPGEPSKGYELIVTDLDSGNGTVLQSRTQLFTLDIKSGVILCTALDGENDRGLPDTEQIISMDFKGGNRKILREYPLEWAYDRRSDGVPVACEAIESLHYGDGRVFFTIEKDLDNSQLRCIFEDGSGAVMDDYVKRVWLHDHKVIYEQWIQGNTFVQMASLDFQERTTLSSDDTFSVSGCYEQFVILNPISWFHDSETYNQRTVDGV